jgi:hypothetical protein
MRPKKIAMQVRINEDLAQQIKKTMPLWQESLGWKVSQQKFVEQACHDFILKLKGKAETEKEDFDPDGYVSGIICTKCNEELPTHKVKDHLDKNHPIHICPHLSRYGKAETEKGDYETA